MKMAVRAAVLLYYCGPALACDVSTDRPVVQATITQTQAANADTAWDAIALDMRTLGHHLYAHEGRVVVNTTVTVFGIESYTTDYLMDKLCNQTLEDAANAVAANARRTLDPTDDDTSGGGNTPTYSPTVIPTFNRWTFRCTVGGRSILCSGYTYGN